MTSESSRVHFHKGLSWQTGLSLIELMIALLLSTLLTLGILTMYLDSTETSRVSRSLARLQESGRIALDLIARDLRMVGYQGCSYPMQDFIPAFVGSNLDSDFYDSGLQGARAGANGWSDTADNFAIPALEASAVTGSDVLQIRRTAGPSFALDQDMADESSVIDTESDRAVAEYLMGQNALITNCAGADIFTVGDPDGLDDDQINHQALSQSYPEGSRIYHFNTTSYWTGDTGRSDQNGNTIFALYQNGLEVVSGIERLQVLYGVRNDDNVQFQDAEDMGNDDWNSVDMVQLGLLVSDEQSVLELADSKAYELPGMTVQPAGTAGADAVYPADDRLRAAFTMTIKVRNRIDVE